MDRGRRRGSRRKGNKKETAEIRARIARRKALQTWNTTSLIR
jgi:hypothetical protein